MFNTTAITALFVMVCLWLVSGIGWVSNIVWLFKTEDVSPEFWIALAGVIVAPLGIIHGWIVLF